MGKQIDHLRNNIWRVITNPKGPLQKKTQVFFPGFDYTSYKTIGGKAKSSLQGFSVDESHVAELASHNWTVIASFETGVDIRLASTSITNPHCKGQIILRPDTMILQTLSTHTPQVVPAWTTHRDEWILNKPRLTVGYTRGHPIWTSQGHALDSTQLTWSILEPHWDTVDKESLLNCGTQSLYDHDQLDKRARSDPCPHSPITEVKRERMIPIKTHRKPCAHNGTEKP